MPATPRGVTRLAAFGGVYANHLALRAVGGSSYFKRLPLERLYRDVRAGIYHPFDSDESIEFLGRSAFGLPMGDPDDYA